MHYSLQKGIATQNNARTQGGGMNEKKRRARAPCRRGSPLVMP